MIKTRILVWTDFGIKNLPDKWTSMAHDWIKLPDKKSIKLLNSNDRCKNDLTMWIRLNKIWTFDGRNTKGFSEKDKKPN